MSLTRAQVTRIIQKIIVFLYSGKKNNWKLELTVASMNTKYFGVNLSKYGEDLNAENYITLIREITVKSLMIPNDLCLLYLNPGY